MTTPEAPRPTGRLGGGGNDLEKKAVASFNTTTLPLETQAICNDSSSATSRRIGGVL